MHKLSSRLLAVVIVLFLTACSSDKSEIHQILDARDQAVSSHDLSAYKKLIHPDYEHLGQNLADISKRIEQLFSQFDTLEMKSSDRVIYFVDDEYAQCEQSYILRVKADNDWRSIAQKERIELRKSASGWKISGGL